MALIKLNAAKALGCVERRSRCFRTGHSLKTVHRILERYLARTRGLAEQAIFNFENSPRTKFANQLQTVVDSKSTKK